MGCSTGVHTSALWRWVAEPGSSFNGGGGGGGLRLNTCAVGTWVCALVQALGWKLSRDLSPDGRDISVGEREWGEQSTWAFNSPTTIPNG